MFYDAFFRRPRPPVKLARGTRADVRTCRPITRTLLVEALEDRRMLADEWIPYVPPPDDVVDLHVAWDGGSATATLDFVMYGYEDVTDWGQVAQAGNNLSADLTVWRWTGIPPAWAMIVQHEYDLGNLAPGNYDFLLTAWGFALSEVGFTIPNPTTFNGTSGDDVFAFSTDGTNHLVTVTVAGQPTQNYTYLASDPVTFTFNGLGGNDTITIIGGEGDDAAYVGQTGKGTVKVLGTGYTVNGSNLETIAVQAGGGTSQTAKLWDTRGNDIFTARYREATMTDDTASYNYSVSGFDLIYAYKNNFGTDQAHFYDSPGTDTFAVKPYAQHAYMSGPGFWNYASGFAKYYGYSTAGGSDFSHLYDSKGDDVYKAWANRDAQVHTPTIDAFAYGFAWNYGRFTAGGANDVAYLYDSSGDDTFFGQALGRLCLSHAAEFLPTARLRLLELRHGL